jgi:hypothetical protein
MARLAASGFTPVEIAEATGFSLFQKEVARIEALADASACDLRQDLNALAVKAICNLEQDVSLADGLESPRDLTNFERNLRFKASTDVLDRVGLGGKNFNVGSLHLHQDEHKHIHSMGVEQLRNEVMDLLRGDS